MLSLLGVLLLLTMEKMYIFGVRYGTLIVLLQKSISGNETR